MSWNIYIYIYQYILHSNKAISYGFNVNIVLKKTLLYYLYTVFMDNLLTDAKIHIIN